jgi:hypothetical protein
MATEDILIRYRADVSQLEADLNKLIKQQEELVDATKANTDEQKKSLSAAEFAAKKRADLLRVEEEKLKKLRDAQKLAFDPVQIEKFNKQISESQRRIALLSDQTEKSAGAITQAFQGAALAIGAAFSAQQITAFAQQSINAFLEAEKASQQLRTNIVTLGGEGEEAFQKLNQQAEQLAKVTLFDDEDIRAAQSQLSVFGLTAEEIEKLLPQVLDFAQATGKDLPTAVQQLGGAVNGIGRGLERYSISVSESATRTENLQSVLAGTAKFAGQAEQATTSLAGQLTQKTKQVEELQESIGQKLVPAYLALGKVQLGVVTFFERLATAISENAGFFKALIPIVITYVGYITRAAQVSAAAAIAERAKAVATGLSAVATRAAAIGQQLLTAATVQGTVATKASSAATEVATVATKGFNAAIRANPLGLLLGLLTSAVIAYQAFADSADEASDASELQKKNLDELNKISQDYNQQLKTEKAELEKLFTAVKLYNTGSKGRQQILDQINAKAGTNLKNLSDEKKFLEQLKTAYETIIPAIEAKIRAQIGEGRLQKAIEQELAAEENLANARADAAKNAKANQEQINKARATQEQINKLKKESANLTGAEKIQLNQQIATLEKRNKVLNTDNSVEQAEEALKNQQKITQAERDKLGELIKANKDAQGKITKANEEGSNTRVKNVEDEYSKILNTINSELNKIQADLKKRQIEILPADSQQQQIDRIKQLADLNEESINDEIAEKIRLVKEDKKLSESQKEDVISKYEELKKKRLELAQFNEQNELNIINKQQVDRIEAAYAEIDALDLEKALTIQADKVETANEAVAKSFEDLSQAVSKADFAAAKDAATARTETLNQELANEKNLRDTQIKANRDAELAKVKDGEAGAIERQAINDKYDLQLENNKKETNKRIAKNNKELNDTITEEDRRATEARIENTFAVLQAVGGLLSEINGLFKAASDQRISEIEAEKEAQLDSIDAQLEANQEFLDSRKISDEEFAANEKALQEEKLRIEKETQKKIRDEKRKQAILDKANALFQIGLNTAIALTRPDVIANPLLIAIIAATSALQAAAVIAQPIPYRKGSKNTGPTGHLARVGEEGEEFVFMPSGSKVLPARQTKRYGEVIDAMFDNRLDDYIHRNYITPALMSQRNAKDSQRSRSFAENIANSITYNQGGLTASDLEAQRKRGQYIRNVDELADAIAKRIPSRDIYRS